MSIKDKDDFRPLDLDDELVRAAIQDTLGRELSDEEIEDMALDDAAESAGFLELEARQSQGLFNYPFKDEEVVVPVDEDGNEIVHSDIDVLRYLSSQFVRREFVFFEIDKLDKPITRADLAMVIDAKIRSTFPNYEIGREKLKAMMDALTNNPIADPGMTIPVWK